MAETSRPSLEDALTLISEGRLDLLPGMAAAYKDEVMRLLADESGEPSEDSKDDEAA